ESVIGAPDHDVDANHRAFGEEGRKRLETPAESLLKHLDHGKADFGVVALARHVNEGGYEAFELVAANENAGPRREVRFHHFAGDPGELFRRDLKQLVARK